MCKEANTNASLILIFILKDYIFLNQPFSISYDIYNNILNISLCGKDEITILSIILIIIIINRSKAIYFL